MLGILARLFRYGLAAGGSIVAKPGATDKVALVVGPELDVAVGSSESLQKTVLAPCVVSMVVHILREQT